MVDFIEVVRGLLSNLTLPIMGILYFLKLRFDLSINNLFPCVLRRILEIERPRLF